MNAIPVGPIEGAQQANSIGSTIRKCLLQLIPSSDVAYYKASKMLVFSNWGVHRALVNKKSGTIERGRKILLWVAIDKHNAIFFEISRSPVPLSSNEIRFLHSVPSALKPLICEGGLRSDTPSLRLSVSMSMGQLLIARHLRGKAAKSYWSSVLILSLLRELTFRRYEGDKCTSGFIFTSKPRIMLPHLSVSDFDFIQFDDAALFGDHFESPASYRYVDGKNSFYVVDNHQRLHGVVKHRNPGAYSLLDRSCGKHVSAIMDGINGRSWAGYIGQNSNVILMTRRGEVFEWSNDFWKIIDRSILSSLLQQEGCGEHVATQLTQVVFALSELRMGSAILVSSDTKSKPELVGDINKARLGESLVSAVVGRSLNDLVVDHSVLKSLSSDGLTRFSIDGNVLGSGEIIKCNVGDGAASGGGRSQACRTASYFGLAIKVSEDGPITIYKDGKNVLKI